MRNKNGFTLIEVMVAMAIIVIVFIAITNSIIYSQMSSSKSRKSLIASYLATEKLAEVNMKYRGKPISEIPESENGDFPKPNNNFSWEIKSQNFEYDLAALATTLLAQQESQSDQLLQILRNLSQSLKESIKEVTVTISWTSERRPRKFSLTTHFIDEQIKLPSLGPGSPTPRREEES